MLGADYDSSADMWSFACMMFEMVTGEFLFEPRKGKGFMKTDEHLAQMMELLGPAPQTTVMRGTKYKGFFNRKGQFRRIRGLAYLPLKTVMLEKYRFKELEAHNFADFLLLMLTWEPEKRAPRLACTATATKAVEMAIRKVLCLDADCTLTVSALCDR